MKLTRLCLPACLLLANAQVHAQKLPNIQEGSQRAPDSIRADGRLTEINNTFKAYNSATGIYYTMANNGQYLYLAVRAHNPLAIRKLIGGGIRLDVKAAGSPLNAQPASITGLMAGSSKSEIGSAYGDRPLISKDSALHRTQTDSLVRLLNQSLYAGMKEIKVKGVDDLTDSLLSVYNDVDIKAMAKFDDNFDLTYELAIPLSILKAGNNPALSYTITLEGLASSTNTHYFDTPIHGDIVAVSTVPRSLSEGVSSGSPDWQTLNYPTSFKGTYQLVK